MCPSSWITTRLEVHLVEVGIARALVPRRGGVEAHVLLDHPAADRVVGLHPEHRRRAASRSRRRRSRPARPAASEVQPAAAQVPATAAGAHDRAEARPRRRRREARAGEVEARAPARAEAGYSRELDGRGPVDGDGLDVADRLVRTVGGGADEVGLPVVGARRRATRNERAASGRRATSGSAAGVVAEVDAAPAGDVQQAGAGEVGRAGDADDHRARAGRWCAPGRRSAGGRGPARPAPAPRSARRARSRSGRSPRRGRAARSDQEGEDESGHSRAIGPGVPRLYSAALSDRASSGCRHEQQLGHRGGADDRGAGRLAGEGQRDGDAEQDDGERLVERLVGARAGASRRREGDPGDEVPADDPEDEAARPSPAAKGPARRARPMSSSRAPWVGRERRRVVIIGSS